MPSNVEPKAVVRTFNYRCFLNKEIPASIKYDAITDQKHLELGEKNETKIVEDRPCDWLELANKDVDQCGLANVLKLAQKGLIDVNSFAFKDEEALDLGDLDAKDPNAVNEVLKSQKANMEKLDNLANQLGTDVDGVIAALMNGTFADLVANSTKKNDVKEGE